MSLSLRPIQTVKVMDPTLDFDERQYYAILKGADRVSWKTIITSSSSNSSATFTAPPPSPMTEVNRDVKLLQPVQIDFVGNAPLGQTLLQSQYDAPRAYPLSSIMETLQVDLNNTSFSINMKDTIHGLLRYHNSDKLKTGNMSTTPTTLDQTQQYSDLANSIRNPLGSIIDSVAGALEPRGSFPYVSLTNNVSGGIGEDTTATANFLFCEDLFLSPLLFGSECEETGFIGLQTFQMTVNWSNDLSRIWCHDNSGGTTLTSIVVTLGVPSLLFQYKTPSPLSQIPASMSYPYYEIQRYPTDLKETIAPNASKPISSSNVQLNSIPRMMYIWARKRNADLTFLDTDTFLSIEKISINWANQSGLLSSASKQDLYKMSQKNGCNLSWMQWSGDGTQYNSGSTQQDIHGPGSVLAIEFGTDIGLAADEAAGLNGTFQLQMEVEVKNQSASDITPTLYVVIVNEGVFTIENNSSYSQIGVISRTDILNAAKQEGINYEDLKFMAGAGGNIFRNFNRKLKYIFSNIRKYAPQIAKAAKTAAPYVSKLLAAGYTMDEANDLAGSAYVGGRGKGGILTKRGGKRISSRQLRKMLTM